MPRERGEVGKGRNMKEIDLQVIWSELELGTSLIAIARRHGVSHTTVVNRLKQDDAWKYAEIMKTRRNAQEIVDLRSTWAELKNGMPITEIARKRKINRATLARKLRRDDPMKYDGIMMTRRHAEKKIVDLQAVWTELYGGTSLTRVAKEYDVSHATLINRLRRDDARNYTRVAKKHRHAEKKNVDLQTVWTELARGLPVTQIAKKYKVAYPTLAGRLRRDNIKKYRKIMEEVRPLKRRISTGFGSPEAKREGADSMLELRVKKLLENHGACFEFHKNLKIREHWYIPDFLFGHTILEVTGLESTDYWNHLKKKAEDYLDSGYGIYVVTSDRAYKICE
ncbi:MAG: hypothetical protein WED04_05110 [Promethearchaeati archaeon SRVP18_Atabeyarchaeia-1]